MYVQYGSSVGMRGVEELRGVSKLVAGERCGTVLYYAVLYCTKGEDHIQQTHAVAATPSTASGRIHTRCSLMPSAPNLKLNPLSIFTHTGSNAFCGAPGRARGKIGEKGRREEAPDVGFGVPVA